MKYLQPPDNCPPITLKSLSSLIHHSPFPCGSDFKGLLIRIYSLIDFNTTTGHLLYARQFI